MGEKVQDLLLLLLLQKSHPRMEQLLPLRPDLKMKLLLKLLLLKLLLLLMLLPKLLLTLELPQMMKLLL